MIQHVAYSWGDRKFSVSAQIVGEAVSAITEDHGRCEPSMLVGMARSKTSPLHALFTWNNKAAAEKWRTHEARQIIRSINVTVAINDGEEVQTPAFISVGHVAETQHAGEGYRSVSVIAADEAFAQEAMHEVLSRIRALKRRYASIEALSPLWKALDELEAA